MSFQELAERRYSCRKFTDKKVDPALLDQIVDVALKAPTAVNTQPFKIFLMNSEGVRETLEKVTPFTFGVDTFLLVGAKLDQGWVRKYDQHNFAEVDASIVATHMMMEIADLGLATTWVGHFDAPLLKELYPVLADYELIALFPIGYEAENYTPSPLHFKSKSKEEVFEVL